MKLPSPVAFEWDDANIEKNWQKHNVHFREAEEIFFNKQIKIFPDSRHSEQEKRYIIYGVTKNGRKLTVIFTLRNNNIRVISVRNQSIKERRQYEKQIKLAEN